MEIWQCASDDGATASNASISNRSWLPQVLVNAPENAVEDGSSAWIPATHVGDPDRVPESWLQLHLNVATVIIWGKN